MSIRVCTFGVRPSFCGSVPFSEFMEFIEFIEFIMSNVNRKKSGVKKR